MATLCPAPPPGQRVWVISRHNGGGLWTSRDGKVVAFKRQDDARRCAGRLWLEACPFPRIVYSKANPYAVEEVQLRWLADRLSRSRAGVRLMGRELQEEDVALAASTDSERHWLERALLRSP